MPAERSIDASAARNELEKLGGLAAIAGGALRVGSSLSAVQQHPAAPYLYLTIDWLLLCGLFALYSQYRETVGRIGLAALFAGTAAICLIRSQAALGRSTYQLGAALLLISVVIFAFVGRRYRALAIAGVLWGMSLIAGAVAALGRATAVPANNAAGALFGLGFLVAGAAAIRNAKTAAPTARLSKLS